jgi:hypothetical protein
MPVAKVSNKFTTQNFRTESPLKAGCIRDPKREWHDFRKPWTFAFELSGRAARQRKQRITQTIGFLPGGFFERGGIISENPVLLPSRGLTNSRHLRPFKQASPLGTRNSFRTGPLGRRFEARRKSTTFWKGTPTAGCG